MPIRLLAVDLDGTLLNGTGEISASNREAIIQAAARGVEVAIVTGRRVHSALPIVAALGCPLTLITSNGARIGTLEGEACHRDFLPAATALDALRATPGFRRYVVAIFDRNGPGQLIVQKGSAPDGPRGWYERSAPESLIEVDDLEAVFEAGAADPIQLMYGGPPDRIDPLENMLRSAIDPTRAQLTWTKYPKRNTVLLDVMNRNCTKGTALRFWAAQRGIEAGEVMALGDNHNDREMLEFAGFPVLMGNAEPDVCRDGWLRTLENDCDGVAAAVRQYILEITP